MAGLRDREVIHASYLWRDAAGEPWLLTFDLAELGGRLECVGMSMWLLTFDLAELGGRLECVGMSMRSFVRDEAGEPGDEYPAYWNPTREEREAVSLYMRSMDAKFARAFYDLERRDTDAVGALGTGYANLAETWNERDLMPRRLRSTDVRGLPLGDVLVRVRRLLAREVDSLMPPDSVLVAGDDTIEAWENGLRDVLAPEQPLQPSRGGRPSKYSHSDLERAAALYRYAFETQDAPSPTKYVAERMGLSPDAASKVVRKCRNAGLLGNTTRGRAGGIEPLTPGRVTSNPGTSDEGSTNDEAH